MGCRPGCRAVIALLALTALTACDGTPRTGAAPRRSVTLAVYDEEGVPIAGARLTLVGETAAVQLAGATPIRVDQPVAGVVRASGYLDEPVVLDPSVTDTTIRLYARTGPTGATRRSFHFGGDVMLGRRYQSTDPDVDTPIVRDAAAARALVSDVAPLMAAADSSMVNLETVIGDLSPLEAYPAKLFLIQSPPIVVDALHQMGVDFVALGNNHSYDWLEDGIRSTVTVLDDADIPWAGAGPTTESAEAGVLLNVDGMAVGVLSTTTADGDFTNNSLPLSTDPIPMEVAVTSQWQYEQRPFRFGGPGDAAYVAPASMRAGDAWRLFDAMEGDLDDASAAALWRELRRVFPELQDTVARRGHGGAARFQRFDVARQVQALRDAGAQLVVVQIHGGTQFSDVPSESMRRVTHDAIDAGADIVIGHHPHVLQGFEFYRGKLIAYSLGNFLFDQDLLSTFSSMMLRVVVEDQRILSTSVVPIVLDRYRPSPATRVTADRIVRTVNAASLLAGSTERLDPLLVGTVLDPKIATNAVLRRAGATYELVERPAPSTNTFTLSPDRVVSLAACSIVATDGSAPAGVEVGFDLLGWGSFDDELADRRNAGGAQWKRDGGLRYDTDRGTYLHLESDAHRSARARPVARLETPHHRWFDDRGRPVDGEPTYTITMDVRRADDPPKIAITLYDVTDVPNEEPTSRELTKVELVVPRTGLDEWDTATLDVSDVVNASYDGLRAEAALVSVVAPAGDNRLDVDDVRVLEWRQLSELPTGVWMPADELRADTAVDVPLQVHGCSPSR